MSAEFDAALAKTEYQNAIASLNRAVRNGDKMRQERDAALALVAAVRTACRAAQDAGQASVPLDALRAAAGLTDSLSDSQPKGMK